MSSSPITPARMQLPGRPDLLTLFDSVPDPRHRRGVRHALPVILAVGVAAVLTGARSFAAIGEWVGDQPEEALARLGVGTGPRPTESTIRRTFARVDANLLDQVIGAHLWTRTRVVDGRRVIAIDGKTVRGARSANAVAPHLVAAFGHTSGTVLGQVAVAAKSNEIPAVRDLLATFDLLAVVVSVDAMHTQKDTAPVITGAGGTTCSRLRRISPVCTERVRTCPGKTSRPTG